MRTQIIAKPSVKLQIKSRMRMRMITITASFALFFIASILILIYNTNNIKTSIAAVTVTSVQTGNWSNGATWNTGTVPASTDAVVIQNDFDVTVDGNSSCASITINAPSSNGTSTLTVNSGITLTVTGGITLNGGTSNTRDADLVLAGTGVITIGGNLAINSTASQRSKVDMSGGASKINLSGAINLTGATTWDPGTLSTLNFNGSTAQTYPSSLGLTFKNVTFNNSSSSGVTPDANIASNKLTGDFRVQTGIFDNAGYTIAGQGALEIVNGATIILKGSSAFPSGFSTFTFGESSTVKYDGNGPQTISDLSYGNLISSNTGDRTLPSNKTIKVAGTFTPGSNSYIITGNTFEYNSANTQTITAFNYNDLVSSNSGTRILPSSGSVRVAGIFTPGTNVYTITGSTVNFNGTGTGPSAQTIPAFNYYNLTSSSTGDRKLASSGVVGVESAFTPGTNTYTDITGSTVEFNSISAQTMSAFNYYNLSSANGGARTLASSGTIGIAGTFTSGGSTYTTTGSTVDFNGSAAQSIPNFSFNNLIVTNSNVSLSGDITLPGNLTISGTFNGSGGTITLSGNWTNNGTFTNGGKIVTFNGTSDQTIGGTSTTTFFDVVVNKSSGNVVLNGPATIDKTLTLTNGKLVSTSVNLLTFTINASVIGGSVSSFISGPVAKNTNSTSAFTFPVGKNNYYRTIKVEPTSTNATTFTAEYFDAVYSNTTNLGAGLNNVSIKEYFQLDRNTGGAPKADARVTLNWGDSSYVNAAALADLRVAKWNGSQWIDMGNSSYSGTSSSGNVTSNIVTSFSPFTLGSSSGSNPLPISLLSFTAEAKGLGVEVNWQTASEINNDFFTIERSIDGTIFTEIAKVAGAGNSNTELSYSIFDDNPIEGNSYYRLKQTDFDGQFEYFPVVFVKWGNASEFKILTVGPNPFVDELKISYVLPQEEKIKCSIMSLRGQIIYEKNLDGSRGVNNFIYKNENNLEQGTYVVVLTGKSKSLSHKFLKAD